MLFFGFAYFASFLRRAGYTASSHTFFLAAYSIQFGILVLGIFHYIDVQPSWSEVEKIKLTLPHLIQGLYVAAAVLVSFGAVVGR
jgi:hypothetical protein